MQGPQPAGNTRWFRGPAERSQAGPGLAPHTAWSIDSTAVTVVQPKLLPKGQRPGPRETHVLSQHAQRGRTTSMPRVAQLPRTSVLLPEQNHALPCNFNQARGEGAHRFNMEVPIPVAARVTNTLDGEFHT